MVRKSIRKRWPLMTPITGVLARRRRVAKSLRLNSLGTKSSVILGRFACGNAPPPTWDSPFAISTVIGKPTSAFAKREARRFSCLWFAWRLWLRGRVLPSPRRYFSAASWREVRMSLSQRRARKKGCFFSAAMCLALPAMIPACGPPSSLSPLKQTRWAPFLSVSFGEFYCEAITCFFLRVVSKYPQPVENSYIQHERQQRYYKGTLKANQEILW